jgi:hypothetical protein
MKKENSNPINSMEIEEIINKLREAGHSEIVDCLLDNEKDCYTKKGRLNKSSTCRRLKWKGKELEDALQEMRVLLAFEYDLNVEKLGNISEDEDEDED